MIIDGKSVALIAAGLTAVMGGIGSAWVWVWQESQLAQCYRRSQIFWTDACASGSARYAGFLCLYSHVFGARQN